MFAGVQHCKPSDREVLLCHKEQLSAPSLDELQLTMALTFATDRLSSCEVFFLNSTRFVVQTFLLLKCHRIEERLP